MRFDKIEKFKIGDLLLDEGNYRFKTAEDQKSCVQKIYLANTPYFKGLMKSIAENDLGEPLLVYRNNGENIVADGNRRLSVLKVLHHDNYAPNNSVKDYAKKLRSRNKIKFSKIQAQVSEDKALVSRTVYERHSGGKNGTSRIPWDAYAAARFGFDAQIGDDKEWRIMALLSKTEEENPQISSFLAGGFSFEVFRRVVRAAIKNGVLSENIFSERGERIKKTARKDLVADAVTKTIKFLSSMQKKELTLSRKGEGYADSATVESYLDDFSLSPDNQELKDAKADADNGSSENSTDQDSNEGDTDETPTGQNDGDDNFGEDDGGQTDSEANEGDTAVGGGNGIERSEAIDKKLKAMNSKKLTGLYHSLCTVSLIKHPALMYVGAWSFLEVLSRCMGNTGPDFTSFYGNKMQGLGIAKPIGKDCSNALKDISSKGNATKHSANATQLTAIQLKNDFEVLQPLILAALDKSISEIKPTTK